MFASGHVRFPSSRLSGFPAFAFTRNPAFVHWERGQAAIAGQPASPCPAAIGGAARGRAQPSAGAAERASWDDAVVDRGPPKLVASRPCGQGSRSLRRRGADAPTPPRPGRLPPPPTPGQARPDKKAAHYPRRANRCEALPPAKARPITACQAARWSTRRNSRPARSRAAAPGAARLARPSSRPRRATAVQRRQGTSMPLPPALMNSRAGPCRRRRRRSRRPAPPVATTTRWTG